VQLGGKKGDLNCMHRVRFVSKLRSRAKVVILSKMASQEEDPPVQGQEIESEGGESSA